VQFAFGLMTRSKAITYDNLTLRAPDFVEASTSRLRRRCRRRASTSMSTSRKCRCSSRSRCATWCWPTAPSSRRCACIRRKRACRTISIWCITARAPSAAPVSSSPKWSASAATRASRPAAPACGPTSRKRSGSASSISSTRTSAAKICLQLGHAGRKGATKLMWDGMDRPLPKAPGTSSRRRRCRTIRTARCRGNRPRRHGPVKAEFVAADDPRRARRLRHAGDALRARLSAGELPVAADQQAHR
jgi:hypothetical protein